MNLEFNIWTSIIIYLLGIITGWGVRSIFQFKGQSVVKDNIAFTVVLLWSGMHILSVFKSIEVPFEIRIVTTVVLAGYFPEIRQFAMNSFTKIKK